MRAPRIHLTREKSGRTSGAGYRDLSATGTPVANDSIENDLKSTVIRMDGFKEESIK